MTYARDLRRVTRKHPNTTKTVERIVREIEANGLPNRVMRIPNLNEAPVYKMRTRIGHYGKLRGRFIFHYENRKVTPLFIYFKGDRDDVTPGEILDALRICHMS